jgi:hypothetical protein
MGNKVLNGFKVVQVPSIVMVVDSVVDWWVVVVVVVVVMAMVAMIKRHVVKGAHPFLGRKQNPLRLSTS